MNIGQIEVAHGVDTFQLSFVGNFGPLTTRSQQ